MIPDRESSERDPSRRDVLESLRGHGAPLSGRRARLPRFDGVTAADRDTPREVLRERRTTVLAFLAARGASDVRVFGALARGEQDVLSDIDPLVERSGAASAGAELLTALGLAEELSQLLHARVDVATPRTLRDEARDSVLAEAVPL